MNFITLILLLVYGGGFWKFWKGYDRTNFERGLQKKMTLSLLWPILFVTNPGYRRNFQKALKGR
jgi:hypothetical protein